MSSVRDFLQHILDESDFLTEKAAQNSHQNFAKTTQL